MDQLDSGKSLSVTNMKQEIGMAVAMLDKVNTATSVRDYRFVAYKLLTRSLNLVRASDLTKRPPFVSDHLFMILNLFFFSVKSLYLSPLISDHLS